MQLQSSTVLREGLRQGVACAGPHRKIDGRWPLKGAFRSRLTLCLCFFPVTCPGLACIALMWFCPLKIVFVKFRNKP